MNILFWNIQKKNLILPVSEILKDHHIDICAFAESEKLDGGVLTTAGFRSVATLSKIKIYTRYSKKIFTLIHEDNRICIAKISTPINGSLIIVFVHLISQINSSTEARVIETLLLMDTVRKLQIKHSTDKVIICGDFNQNPYDTGVICGGGFNATPDREIARKMKRVVQSKSYAYFYNPMWRFYGASTRPFGTYFHKSSDHIAVNWNILDQFLISSTLIDLIKDDDFSIITCTNTSRFIRSNGNIDYKNYSDHLPILMKSTI